MGAVPGLPHDLVRVRAGPERFGDEPGPGYVHASSADVLVAGGVQVSVLDPFKPYLNDRLAEGVPNDTLLLAEITEQGSPYGHPCPPRWPLAGVGAATATRASRRRDAGSLLVRL